MTFNLTRSTPAIRIILALNLIFRPGGSRGFFPDVNETGLLLRVTILLK